MKILPLVIPLLAACGGGSDFESSFTDAQGNTIKCETDYRDNYTRAETKCRETTRAPSSSGTANAPGPAPVPGRTS